MAAEGMCVARQAGGTQLAHENKTWTWNGTQGNKISAPEGSVRHKKG